MIRDPESGWIEATVTINGHTLSFAEAMTLRVAVGGMLISLGDAEFRKHLGLIAEGYDTHLRRIEAYMRREAT
jgi:hypothetical protein